MQHGKSDGVGAIIVPAPSAAWQRLLIRAFPAKAMRDTPSPNQACAYLQRAVRRRQRAVQAVMLPLHVLCLLRQGHRDVHVAHLARLLALPEQVCTVGGAHVSSTAAGMREAPLAGRVALLKR